MKPTATPARALAGLLALLLALLSLAACSGEDDSPALPVLQAHEDGSATLTVRLDAQTLQAHAGQTARLFALSPGEDVSAVAGRQPLDEQEIAARLRFPVAVGGSGLYCTYAVVFSDGTPLAGTPLSLSNPEILAADASPFPHRGAFQIRHIRQIRAPEGAVGGVSAGSGKIKDFRCFSKA